MPDMIFYGTNSTTCVVKPHCLPSVYANPKFTCVPVSQDNELPVDHLLLLHSPHRLQALLRNEGMSAALAFGDPVVRRYSIYESPTPMPNHIYQLKSPRSLNVRRRRRRVSIWPAALKCGRILHLWYTLLTELQAVRRVALRNDWQVCWLSNGSGSIPK